MKTPIFLNAATALYTPFTDGKVNFDEFEELVENQLKSGISALVFLGTTGESATVTDSEREEIIRFAVETVKRKVPVIIGCGSNCTEKAVYLTKQAKNAGADCALSVTPYYNKCNQEGLFRHYETVSDEAEMPIIVYNVPKRTGVRIEPETAEKLAAIKNIVGLKEADDEKARYEKTIRALDGKIAVYSGSDSEVFDFYELGASGAISVASNVIPRKFSDIYFNFKNYSETEKRKLKEFFGLFSIDINPIPLKAILKILGKKGYETRLPITEISEEKAEYLADALNKIDIGDIYDELNYMRSERQNGQRGLRRSEKEKL